MKDTLKYNPYIEQPVKAALLRNRVELMTRSLNAWCNMLIIDNVIDNAATHNDIAVAAYFRFKDLSHINARLSEYAQFVGGEM